MSGILAFFVAFERALTQCAWKCVTSDKSLFSRTGSQMLLFELRRYCWLFLVIAVLLVSMCVSVVVNYMFRCQFLVINQ